MIVSMSFSKQILLALALGTLVGLFLGEYASFFNIAADIYVKLLQMSVLPYVTVSIIYSIGSLSYPMVRRLGVRVGSIILFIWAISLVYALLFAVVFPHITNASFFSPALVESTESFDFVNLYIPSNPFHSLANNIVPAVVLFSLITGIALIGIEKKQILLEPLAILEQTISRATRFIVKLTPYGLFAIAAFTAGTLTIDQIERLEIYLVTYVAVSFLLGLWVLPGLISALTPIKSRAALQATKDALITAFMTSNLFIVLPILTEACEKLLKQNQITSEGAENMPEVIVPASFNLPHAGKLMSLSFIIFAGWFADAPIRLLEYPRLAFTGLVTFFGSLNVAMPFLLDLFRIPADMFQLFIATSVVNSRFGSFVAAVHTMTVALIGSCAVAGFVKIESARVIRYVVITGLLTLLVFGGIRLFFTFAWKPDYVMDRMITQMQPLKKSVPPKLQETRPQEISDPNKPVLQTIQQRKTLRVGYLSDSLPYAYLNTNGTMVGLDVGARKCSGARASS